MVVTLLLKYTMYRTTITLKEFPDGGPEFGRNALKDWINWWKTVKRQTQGPWQQVNRQDHRPNENFPFRRLERFLVLVNLLFIKLVLYIFMLFISIVHGLLLNLWCTKCWGFYVYFVCLVRKDNFVLKISFWPNGNYHFELNFEVTQ